MITPVKKLTVAALRDYEGLVMRELGRLGVIQLKELDELEYLGFKSEDSRVIKELESLYQRLLDLGRKLGIEIGEGADGMRFEDARRTLLELEERAEKLLKEIKRIEDRLKRVDVERMKLLKMALEGFVKLGEKRFPELGEHENIFVKAGFVDLKHLKRLERVRVSKSILLRWTQISESELFLYAVGIIDLKEPLERFLSSLGFKEIEELEDAPKNLEDALKWVDEKIKKAEEELAGTKEELKELKIGLEEVRREFSEKSGAISRALREELAIRRGLLKTVKSDMMRVVQGWVPADKLSSVKKILEDLRVRIRGLLFYEVADPDPEEEIPTILKNPKLFSAFETLTRQYGWPEPKESDPTIISALLWTIMFGMMFPDFGHGLTIALLGALFAYVIRRRFMELNFIRIGKLLIALGISSMIFGLMAGEFFLIEVQPLLPWLKIGWVKDTVTVLWLIKIAVFFGVAQIILALIMAVRNHLREGEVLEAVLGERGVASLIAFIGMVLTAFHFLGISMIPGLLELPELRMDVLNHWSFYLLLLGLILVFIKPIIAGEGASLGLGMVLEVAISYLANMLSYTRIAGFAIAHAALAIVVHKLMEASPLLGIGMGLIFLNLFALTLELLVCMIQALRLLYYEFSTKFFRGTGKPYSPWRI